MIIRSGKKTFIKIAHFSLPYMAEQFASRQWACVVSFFLFLATPLAFGVSPCTNEATAGAHPLAETAQSFLQLVHQASDFHVEMPFHHATDSLCFGNGHDGFTHAGSFPFNLIGESNGVCQGISGIASAFMRNVRFSPSRPRPTRGEAEDMISLASAFSINGCLHPFTIPGFANMREFCAVYGHELRTAVLDMNLAIAMGQIFDQIGEYSSLREFGAIRRRTQATLQSVIAGLIASRRPLLLYRSHVVMVNSAERREATLNNVTGTWLILGIYDPNHMEHPIQLWFKINPTTDAPLEARAYQVEPEVSIMSSIRSIDAPFFDVSSDIRQDVSRCNQLMENYHYLMPDLPPLPQNYWPWD